MIWLHKYKCRSRKIVFRLFLTCTELKAKQSNTDEENVLYYIGKWHNDLTLLQWFCRTCRSAYEYSAMCTIKRKESFLVFRRFRILWPWRREQILYDKSNCFLKFIPYNNKCLRNLRLFVCGNTILTLHFDCVNNFYLGFFFFSFFFCKFFDILLDVKITILKPNEEVCICYW